MQISGFFVRALKSEDPIEAEENGKITIGKEADARTHANVYVFLSFF
jgi:hypothetical protein